MSATVSPASSTLAEVEGIANEVLPVVGAAVGAAIPGAAPFVAPVVAGVEAAEQVAPDVVTQVQNLTAAHAATADKVTAATGLLADIVAFLARLFPGHSVPGAS
jgi:hypothetical protein